MAIRFAEWPTEYAEQKLWAEKKKKKLCAEKGPCPIHEFSNFFYDHSIICNIR